MSADLEQILTHWMSRRDAARWVLGTVFRTRGHSYRKAGAMMLLSDEGERLGLLSGGCLEADLMHHAQLLFQRGGAKTVRYDTLDEGDIAYQLGLGCGGAVDILLQAVSREGDELGLTRAAERLTAGKSGCLVLHVPRGTGEARGTVSTAGPSCDDAGAKRRRDQGCRRLADARLVEQEDGSGRLFVPFRPAPQLLVVGGGVDARPVVVMARELGWRVLLCDPRPAFGRSRHFVGAHIHKGPPSELGQQHIDLAIVMSHNLTIDAEALGFLADHRELRYLGLLGPVSRRDRVLRRAGLQRDHFPCALSAPAGLDLGGRLPADIALSLVAACQAALHDRLAVPLEQRTDGFLPKAPPEDSLRRDVG